ncbi:MAG: hypothetical protein OXQ29_17775 [Rhodospirillaceae bacterium]|nr:hypothetical protein [Rhodospirillaceae bacterium]
MASFTDVDANRILLNAGLYGGDQGWFELTEVADIVATIDGAIDADNNYDTRFDALAAQKVLRIYRVRNQEAPQDLIRQRLIELQQIQTPQISTELTVAQIIALIRANAPAPDLSAYYTKTEVDTIIGRVQAGEGADLESYYTKTQADARFAGILGTKIGDVMVADGGDGTIAGVVSSLPTVVLVTMTGHAYAAQTVLSSDFTSGVSLVPAGALGVGITITTDGDDLDVTNQNSGEAITVAVWR